MEKIYTEVAKELIKIYNHNSSLLFPKYYNNDTKEFRVSEQESKIIFANIFLKQEIPFAIEVPTKSKHNFTGNGGKPKSARYDMAVFYEDRDTSRIKYAIELKAHNPEKEKIRKDIEKFACSDLNCIWFHTLEKSDANTYKTLLHKINEAILSEKHKIVGNHQWEFVIISLKEKTLYTFSTSISNSSNFELVLKDSLKKQL